MGCALKNVFVSIKKNLYIPIPWVVSECTVSQCLRHTIISVRGHSDEKCVLRWVCLGHSAESIQCAVGPLTQACDPRLKDLVEMARSPQYFKLPLAPPAT